MSSTHSCSDDQSLSMVPEIICRAQSEDEVDGEECPECLESPCYCAEKQEQERQTFGPLLDITEEALVSLASRIASQYLQVKTTGGRLIKRLSGSYNLVHIMELDSDEHPDTLKLVIRTPASGWGEGLTPIAAQAMESQTATLRLIRSQTDAPVPEVYDMDVTTNNEIGAPYYCINLFQGRPVWDYWYGPLKDEAMRLKILTSLARAMAKFAPLRFNKIGSIHQAGDGSYFIGPTYDWEEAGDEGRTCIKKTSDPVSSLSDQLTAIYEARIAEVLAAKGIHHDRDLGQQKIMTCLLRCLSATESLSAPGFTLAPPDFNAQNIMVDDEGNVTGLIDWDNAQTWPRNRGYVRYPFWLTRDWDPLVYGWPVKPKEDSPTDLERYRAHYSAELARALNWQGDWKLSRTSHVAEAIEIAVHSQWNCNYICGLFVNMAFQGVEMSKSKDYIPTYDAYSDDDDDSDDDEEEKEEEEEEETARERDTDDDSSDEDNDDEDEAKEIQDLLNGDNHGVIKLARLGEGWFSDDTMARMEANLEQQVMCRLNPSFSKWTRKGLTAAVCFAVLSLIVVCRVSFSLA